MSLYQQARRALLDNTFAGIHQLDWFDWAILIPYFGLLGILSLYGLHRYEVIRTYFKYRKKLPKEPPTRFEQLPPVTIQLPLYNERFVVERLLEEVLKIDYPRDLLQIQVLDDSTDETHAFAERLVARYRALGHPIEYHHRTNRAGFKAGALQEGLKTATGELVAIFDADFIPPADFLMRTVHFFADPQVGVVQTRWSYINRDSNVLTEVQAMLLDGHFVLEHGARYGRGLFFNFNGTAGILRRKMIDDAGGWQHDTLTEDSDLSYRAQLKGWKFVYLPGLDCPSELPVEMHAFQVQQSRWAKGLTQVAKKLLPTILRAKVPAARQARSVPAPDAEHQLPDDDGGVGADAAGDDRAVLHGLDADGVSGSAADRRFVLVDLGVLCAGAARIVSAQTGRARLLLLPAAAGRGRGADRHQHAGGVRSAARRPDRLRADAEVRRSDKRRRSAGREVPPPQRLAAFHRTRDRNLFRGDGGVRDRRLQLLLAAVPAAVRCRLLLGGFSTLIQEYRDRLRTARAAVALEAAAR